MRYKEIELNQDYIHLLKQNVSLSKGKVINTDHKMLQRQLLQFEKELSAVEIIRHAEYCFPQVTNE